MSIPWEHIYAAQDWALAIVAEVEQGFYLTGGTALARGYYQHRYSEDLDFFANDRPEFELWRDRCLSELGRRCKEKGTGSLEILLREPRFGRALIHGEVDLKLEFINDVPFRVGNPVRHPSLGVVDTKENILANKITALIDRNEPKDIADIFWLCCRDSLNLEEALTAASGKAAGVFPPIVSKRLVEAAGRGTPRVYWIDPPTHEDFGGGIQTLADSLLRL